MFGRATRIVPILLIATLLAGASTAAAELAWSDRPALDRTNPSIERADSLWDRIPDFPGPPDSAINGLFRTSFGVVAAGQRRSGESGIWTSPNGRDWVRVRDPELFDQTSAITGIDTPTGAIVVGSVFDPDLIVAAMWRSTDGETWQRVDGGRQFNGGNMTDAVRGGPGYVIVGSHYLRGRSVVWTSVDGGTWHRVPRQPSLELTQMFAVERIGSTLVAVGWRLADQPRAAVWTSTDGLAWELATDLPDGEGGFADAVAVRNGRLVVGGVDLEGGPPLLWTSTDAGSWERLSLPGAADGAVYGLTASRNGWVAVGTRNGDDAGVWTSPDGLAWSVVRDPAAFTDASMTSIIPFRGGYLSGGILQEQIPGTGSYDIWAQVWRR